MYHNVQQRGVFSDGGCQAHPLLAGGLARRGKGIAFCLPILALSRVILGVESNSHGILLDFPHSKSRTLTYPINGLMRRFVAYVGGKCTRRTPLAGRVA